MEEEKQGPDCGHSRCSQHFVDTGSSACLVVSDLASLDEYLRTDGNNLAHQLERLGENLDLGFVKQLAEQIREAARLAELECIARDMKASVGFCTNCGSSGVELEAWVLVNSGQVLEYNGSDTGSCHQCDEHTYNGARIDFEDVPRAEQQKRIDERHAMGVQWVEENHPPKS